MTSPGAVAPVRPAPGPQRLRSENQSLPVLTSSLTNVTRLADCVNSASNNARRHPCRGDARQREGVAPIRHADGSGELDDVVLLEVRRRHPTEIPRLGVEEHDPLKPVAGQTHRRDGSHPGQAVAGARRPALSPENLDRVEARSQTIDIGCPRGGTLGPGDRDALMVPLDGAQAVPGGERRVEVGRGVLPVGRDGDEPHARIAPGPVRVVHGSDEFHGDIRDLQRPSRASVRAGVEASVPQLELDVRRQERPGQSVRYFRHRPIPMSWVVGDRVHRLTTRAALSTHECSHEIATRLPAGTRLAGSRPDPLWMRTGASWIRR